MFGPNPCFFVEETELVLRNSRSLACFAVTMAFLSTGFLLWKSNAISPSTKYRQITMASSSDVEAIKDVLQTQQQLLQRLYGELDEERELSSCAADEAMAMIVRLQAEKAKLKMEASQYRREAQEKMCLAEESLAIFEDLIDQKEAEIAYVEFQLQFYRNKLISMGYTDLAIPEFEYPYNPDQREVNNVVNEYTNSSDQKRKSVELRKCSIPMVPKKGGGSASAGGDIKEYWEHIKKLEEQVKKISNNRTPRRVESTSFGNRPVRSCSEPPPDIEGSGLSAPVGV